MWLCAPLVIPKLSGTVTTRPYCQEISDLAGARLVSISPVVAIVVLAAALVAVAIYMERERLRGHAGKLAARGRRMTVLAGRRRLAVLAGLVIAVAVGVFALLFARAGGPPLFARAGGPPPNPGAYRVVPPPQFEGARLSAATGPGSAVWSDGIKRFPGATPVTAVYDQDGQPWLYAWGAEGKLTDPAGELAAFWQAWDPLAAPMGIPLPPSDNEPTGPLGGTLQCQEVFQVCAWADYSGIVVVSPQSFNDTGMITTSPTTSLPLTITEQQMDAMTLSFRGVAEQLRHDTQTHH
jgi:hypothetical protein